MKPPKACSDVEIDATIRAIAQRREELTTLAILYADERDARRALGRQVDAALTPMAWLEEDA